MGFHGFSPVSLLLTLLIVVLLFGTRRLRDVGRDLGEAVKSFRDGMHHSEENKPATPPAELSQKDKPL